MKIDLAKLLDKAQGGGWALRKLNFMLSMGIPFNRPHGIKVHSVSAQSVTTVIPHRKVNLNHIKGIHACGLATAAEFCSGLVLLRKLDPRKYRLIMQKIEVEYHFQARSSAYAKFEIDDSVLQKEIISTIEKTGAAFYTCEIPVHDTEGNHLCTAQTRWQIKPWDKVKTKT